MSVEPIDRIGEVGDIRVDVAGGRVFIGQVFDEIEIEPGQAINLIALLEASLEKVYERTNIGEAK